MSANDTLGKVFVSQDELLKGQGERVEYQLLDDASEAKKLTARPMRELRQVENALADAGKETRSLLKGTVENKELPIRPIHKLKEMVTSSHHKEHKVRGVKWLCENCSWPILTVVLAHFAGKACLALSKSH